MGVLYTHSSKMATPSPNFLRKLQTIQKNPKKWKKRASPQSVELWACGWRATAGHRLAANECPKLDPSKILLPPLTPKFLHMWLTLAGWLQHMPTQTSPKNFKHP
jgi:hypothetical protein